MIVLGKKRRYRNEMNSTASAQNGSHMGKSSSKHTSKEHDDVEIVCRRVVGEHAPVVLGKSGKETANAGTYLLPHLANL